MLDKSHTQPSNPTLRLSQSHSPHVSPVTLETYNFFVIFFRALFCFVAHLGLGLVFLLLLDLQQEGAVDTW